MAITLNGTTGISSPGGDTSTSLATTNLSYTGTLTGGTGVIAIGTNQIYKDASGNVGIGTASPSGKLHVSGSVTSGGSIGLIISDTTASLSAQLFRTGSAYSYAGVGANETWLYSQGASNLSLGPDGAASVKIVTNGFLRATFDSSGNLGLGVTPNNSYNACLQLKSGITFPATQSASSDANTLDDYEEGTWTPALSNFTGSAGWSASGTYVKIGRIVYLDATLSPGSGTISATANSSSISGLPFSVAKAAVVGWSTNYIETLGTGVIYPTASVLYTSTFSVTNVKTIYSSGVYITAT